MKSRLVYRRDEIGLAPHLLLGSVPALWDRSAYAVGPKDRVEIRDCLQWEASRQLESVEAGVVHQVDEDLE